MKEAYVSFETAKLLKEKGFDWGTQYVYTEDGAGCTPPKIGKWKAKSNIPMVTHQMACAWLREVHDLYIEVIRGYDHFFVSINKMHPLREYSMKNDTFDDYDEAVEETIKYVLENLI